MTEKISYRKAKQLSTETFTRRDSFKGIALGALALFAPKLYLPDPAEKKIFIGPFFSPVHRSSMERFEVALAKARAEGKEPQSLFLTEEDLREYVVELTAMSRYPLRFPRRRDGLKRYFYDQLPIQQRWPYNEPFGGSYLACDGESFVEYSAGEPYPGFKRSYYEIPRD